VQGSSGKNPLRKRAEPRSANLKNYRIEIKLVGEPIYQFRVINVSTKGAGILIKDNSAFLDMIEVGQIVDVNFISPESSNPSGMYTAEIKHITKTYKNERQGQQLVGLSILKNLDQT
jgi:hypothetical protein